MNSRSLIRRAFPPIRNEKSAFHQKHRIQGGMKNSESAGLGTCKRGEGDQSTADQIAADQ
jgi:hypothetical protein